MQKVIRRVIAVTLDEAIKTYENNAEYERTHGTLQGCLDFKLLAGWLRELKQRRNNENDCQYCKYIFRSDKNEPCVICSHNYTDKFKDDGTREVNTDGDSD